MNQLQKNTKEPMAAQKIYRIMLTVTYLVAAYFLIKNVITVNVPAIIIIGVCLAVLATSATIMHYRKTAGSIKYYLVAVVLPFVVFIISLFSGESYSDDFGLYIAIIAVTGLFMTPKYTITQGIQSVILLMVQYFIHPEKGGDFGQYLTCVVIFAIGSFMFYLAIQRGRAFILISEQRAHEAERLLASLKEISMDLQENFEKSSRLLLNLQDANRQLEQNSEELRLGSDGIIEGTKDVSATCDDVHAKVQLTGQQVKELNSEVNTFEDVLSTNYVHINKMTDRLEDVRKMMQQAISVFHLLENQMMQIYEVTEKLNSISNSTTMLALNASIEAARAGQHGAGFAVVASKVQELAVDSTKCSGQVAEVVNAMQEQIQNTTLQLDGSEQAILNSFEALAALQNSFAQLTTHFGSLYENIAEQNNNISQVDSIFGELANKVTEMSDYSEANREAVNAITAAMAVYQENMQMVIDDTKHLHELSSSMLEVTDEE